MWAVERRHPDVPQSQILCPYVQMKNLTTSGSPTTEVRCYISRPARSRGTHTACGPRIYGARTTARLAERVSRKVSNGKQRAAAFSRAS